MNSSFTYSHLKLLVKVEPGFLEVSFKIPDEPNEPGVLDSFVTTETQHASVPLWPPRPSSGTFERPLGATQLAELQHFRDGEEAAVAARTSLSRLMEVRS